MENRIFLDTSGFFAFLVRGDQKHEQASTCVHEIIKKSGRMITTDYIIDETATLLKAREFGHYIQPFFEGILSSKACRIEWMDGDYFESTKAMFLKHADQQWSFTDCFSFSVMKNLGLRQALSKDTHFGHAGFVSLLK
jgi:hypothetical protein